MRLARSHMLKSVLKCVKGRFPFQIVAENQGPYRLPIRTWGLVREPSVPVRSTPRYHHFHRLFLQDAGEKVVIKACNRTVPSGKFLVAIVIS